MSTIDISQLAGYTPQQSKIEGQVPETIISPEQLRSRVRDYLEKQGYEVTEGAKLVGKSGIEHSFDMLARKDDGLNGYHIAVCITAGGDHEVEATTIFGFANKAYDTGVSDRVLVASPPLSKEAKALALKQRIKIIDGERIQALLHTKSTPVAPAREQLRFANRQELIESLKNRGYHVKEKTRVRGRSGIEYNFDIIAQSSFDQATHTLGIDLLDGQKEIGLEHVSLFDTKAYDVGLDEKALVIADNLSIEAQKFAQYQRIKLFTLGDAVALPPTKPEKETPAAKAPEKTSAAKGQAGKTLRQMPQPEALQLVPEVTARRYNAIPLAIVGNTLQVAMGNPTDIFALEALATQTRMRIDPVGAAEKEVREAIDFNYKGYGEIEKQISDVRISADDTEEGIDVTATIDTPLTQALNMLIEEAVKARASDIHICPEDNGLRIRYRIDGILQDMMSLPTSIRRALISRIKILADLNIADHQHPQDGQFSYMAKGREIDVRVATAPSVWGEMAVLRLLDKSMAILGLSELGMLPDSLQRYESMLKVPYGMILISGPTGAGKTTTLYSSINSLDKMTRNIVTVEDPAEYRFKQINQIQVNNQAGITFATGLRSILRLDPDVILVGEIRDAETANIAVQSALTGHLMLSSIHASDTTGVLFRLMDLKIEPFLLASSIIGIVAQRMVRRVCPDCARPIEVPAVEQIAYEREMGEKQTKFMYGTGCKSCAYTGYLGRTGIFEILTMSDTLRMMIVKQAGSVEIREQALKEGMVPMIRDGMQKVKLGTTTPYEVLRSAFAI